MCQLIEEIIPLLHRSDSVERCLYAIASFELDIQNLARKLASPKGARASLALEARVENIQQEIEVLIAEQ